MKKKVLSIVLVTVVAVSSFMFGAVQKEKEMEVVIEENYIDTTTYEFFNNYIDMREIADFDATEEGLSLYMDNGNWYEWCR